MCSWFRPGRVELEWQRGGSAGRNNPTIAAGKDPLFLSTECLFAYYVVHDYRRCITGSHELD